MKSIPIIDFRFEAENMNEKIVNIFSIPIYKTLLNYKISEKDNEDLYKIIETKDTETGGRQEGDAQFDDVFVLDTSFQKLKEEILIHLNNYIKKIHDSDAKFKIKITQSWFNIYKMNWNLSEHFHPNSFISGIYYLKARKEVDMIVFRDHRMYEKYGFQFEEKDTANNLIQEYNAVTGLEEGILLLFPSSLRHFVPDIPSTQDNEDNDKIVRISLSFNTFITGNVGSIDNRSFLEL